MPEGDPRIILVFLTPFGSFTGSGSDTLPVLGLATFYVTGWTARAAVSTTPARATATTPCRTTPGEIVGHFIKYIETLNARRPGASRATSDAFDAAPPCPSNKEDLQMQ